MASGQPRANRRVCGPADPRQVAHVDEDRADIPVRGRGDHEIFEPGVLERCGEAERRRMEVTVHVEHLEEGGGADDPRTGLEHPKRLCHELVRAAHVFENRERDDAVERGFAEGQRMGVDEVRDIADGVDIDRVDASRLQE